MKNLVVVLLLFSNSVFAQVKMQTNKKDTVEFQPEFPTGQTEMFRFIGKNMRYPETPRNNGIQGTLYVGFVVDSTGKLENINIKAQRLYKLKRNKILSKFQEEKVEKDDELANECLRVVKLMPNWKPGTQNGKPVRVAYTLPLKFKLE
jgi:periplasmic protein TonB